MHAGLGVQSAKLHKRTGTPLYMAPELFMRYYGVESDMVRTFAPGGLSQCAGGWHLYVWRCELGKSGKLQVGGSKTETDSVRYGHGALRCEP